MPNLYTAATINKFAQEGENAFSVAYPCILKRISLATTANVETVTLPDDVKSIQRVTWKGVKLDPLPQRNFREVFQNGGQQGKPFWYVYNNVGQNLLQLFPAPNETLTSTSENLYGSEIPNRLIVTYFALPDFISYTIPSYIRRRLLKAYVLRGCFSIEGQGQSLKASKYFKSRWEQLSLLYGTLLSDLHNKPRKLVISGIESAYYFPGQPILPIDRFGISVNTGE